MEKNNPYCIVDKSGVSQSNPFFYQGKVHKWRPTIFNPPTYLVLNMFYDFYNVTSNFGGSLRTHIPTLKATIIFTLRRKNLTFGSNIAWDGSLLQKREKEFLLIQSKVGSTNLIFFYQHHIKLREKSQFRFLAYPVAIKAAEEWLCRSCHRFRLSSVVSNWSCVPDVGELELSVKL